MRLLISLVVIMLCSCIKQQSFPTDAQLKAIDPKEMKEVLTYIASDEMKGRDTGSPEQLTVANFLAKELKSYGYQGLAENGSFLQSFTIFNHKVDSSSVKVSYSKDLGINVFNNFVIFSRSGSSVSAEGQMYFVVNGELTQFDTTLVKDKILFRYPASEKSQAERSLISKLYDRFGAKLVVTISDNSSMFNERFGMTVASAKYGRMSLQEDPKKNDAVALINEDKFLAIVKNEKKQLNKKVALLFNNGIKIEMQNNNERINTQNVVALLKGTDESLASQYVGFGAHYDHIGVNKDGQVNNGADDDGSGTAGVLQMAKAIALNPPKRSIFIIFHTAEEKGLYGSEYFTQNPLVPLDSIVTVFNSDMIGRSRAESDTTAANKQLTLANEIYLVGADRISKELHTISEDANQKIDKLKLNYELNDENHPDRIYYRSDHWNYAKNGIPVIFYFDGVHIDYHQYTDDVEKIDFEKMARVCRLTLATGLVVANKSERLILNAK